MILYIKYMVSLRCKMLVKDELKKLGIRCISVDLGEAQIAQPLTAEQQEQLKEHLLNAGLELMDDRKSILIERIKTTIIELIHYTDEAPKTNYSDYISNKLNFDYTYLSNIFSEVTGTTIQQYIISNKIERVKELLLYEELNIKEIAYKLNYSSVAHLCNQFKKVTGLTPTYYKKLKIKRNRTIESL